MNSPYTDKELYRVIPLYPYQMRTNIYTHLKENLENDVLNKCTSEGYICKVYDIKHYSDGELPLEDPNGNAKYNIKYSAKICCPINGMMILCKITLITNTFAEAVNS